VNAVCKVIFAIKGPERLAEPGQRLLSALADEANQTFPREVLKVEATDPL